MSSNNDLPACPVATTVDIIENKWKLLIMRELLVGTKRFNELHRAIDGVSQKVLTQNLRKMEEDGIVFREVFAEVPPKVEYSLNELGQSLSPIIEAMKSWGTDYLLNEYQKD